jgi:hypothetical protein
MGFDRDCLLLFRLACRNGRPVAVGHKTGTACGNQMETALAERILIAVNTEYWMHELPVNVIPKYGPRRGAGTSLREWTAASLPFSFYPLNIL